MWIDRDHEAGEAGRRGRSKQPGRPRLGLSSTRTELLGEDDFGSDDVIDTLTELIATCRAGERSCQRGGLQARSDALKAALGEGAEAFRLCADQLQEQLDAFGPAPSAVSTAAGSMQRAWRALRAALAAGDDRPVYEDCERGEGRMLERYRRALRKQMPPRIRAVVAQHYQAMQQHHERVKALRPQLSA